MGALTHRRAKAALPIVGSLRIIDFAMSNLALSGIDRVGVISQYRPSSLMDHVGDGAAWGLVGRGREVRVLSPYQADDSVEWYRGTADAVFRNLSFLRGERYVLIVSGDHVYHMDYRPLLDAHEASGAELTMVFKRFPLADCRRYGNVEVDPQMRIRQYIEKPSDPLSNLGSLTIYLFNRAALEERLAEVQSSQGDIQLYQDVLPDFVARGTARAFVHDGYWAYARTIDDYFKTSMDLLAPDSGFRIDDWEVCTNVEQAGIGNVPPAVVGMNADVSRCRLSPGCRIYGKVSNTVISPGVVVEEGAEVSDSVLMHRVHVAAGVRITRAIVDKHVRVAADAIVGSSVPAKANEELPESQATGVTVLGRAARIGAGARVGSNCQVFPGLEVPAGGVVEDATCVPRMGGRP
jgi:glucose-1-phosphate adenylyltransferase